MEMSRLLRITYVLFIKCGLSISVQAQDGITFSLTEATDNAKYNLRIENTDSEYVYLVMINDLYYSDTAFVLNITLIDSCGVFSSSSLDHLPFYYQFEYKALKSYPLTLHYDEISCLRIKYYKIHIDSWPPKKKSPRRSYRKYLDYIRKVGIFRELTIPLG
jgi:hypothetical protein